jgi:hypothetical protein
LVFVEGACAGTAVDRRRTRGRPHRHQYGRCVDAAAGIDERGAPQGRCDRSVPATTRTFPPGRGPGTGEGDRDSNGRTESTADDGGDHEGPCGGTPQEGGASVRTKAVTRQDRSGTGTEPVTGCRAGGAVAPTHAGKRHARMQRGRIGADPPGWWHPGPGWGCDGERTYGRVQEAWPAPKLGRTHRGKAGCRQGREDCPVLHRRCGRAISFWGD